MYKGSETTLIADVDCTAGGRELCKEHDVQSYPTLKYGDPKSPDDYTGPRDFNSLKKFAAESLHGICGPGRLELCDEATKKEIKKYQKLSKHELAMAISAKQAEYDKTKQDFKDYIDRIQLEYQQEQKQTDEQIEAIKYSGGLQLMKAVRVHRESLKAQGESKKGGSEFKEL